MTKEIRIVDEVSGNELLRGTLAMGNYDSDGETLFLRDIRANEYSPALRALVESLEWQGVAAVDAEDRNAKPRGDGR